MTAAAAVTSRMPKRKREDDWGALADLHTAISDAPPDEATLDRLQTLLERLAVEAQKHVDDLQARVENALDAAHKSPQTVSIDVDAQSDPEVLRVNDEGMETKSRNAERDGPDNDTVVKKEHVKSERAAESKPPLSSPASPTGSKSLDANTKNSGKSSPESGSPRFVPNPKAEYVAAQELPLAAMNLFNEDDHGENEDIEAKKRRLGVVSFPTVPLEDLLPGKIPDEDFTQAKPANQVQATTYATFLEPYFRLFTEEDVGVLEQPTVGAEVVSFGRTISPYVIPPLGPYYLETWAEEDRKQGMPTSNAESHTQASEESKRYEPVGSVNDITDRALEEGEIGLGPLTSRLVSAILPDGTDADAEAGGLAAEESNGNDITAEEPTVATLVPGPDKGSAPLFSDFSGLEERVKSEFRYVGILDMSILKQYNQNKRSFQLAVPQANSSLAGGMEDSVFGAFGGIGGHGDSDQGLGDIDWVNGTEDDEISRELRTLQTKLHKVSEANLKYKKRLLPYVQEQMAWQEYSSILSDLDKQVDQAYIKRLKVPKPKTKKATSSGATDTPSPVPVQADVRPAVRALLDKRARWISKIGSIFSAPHEMMRSHEHPKFQ